jgi:hypothetical protein
LRFKVHAKIPRLGMDIVCARCGTIHRIAKPSPGTFRKLDVPGRI